MQNFIKERVSRIRPDYIRLLSNSVWSASDKVIHLFVGLFLGVWTARYLGPEQFGLLNYAIAFSGVFSFLSQMGLQQIVLRNSVRNPENRDEIIGTAIILQIIGGLLTVTLSYFAIILISPNSKLSIYLILIISVGHFFRFGNAIDYWFQSEEKHKYTAFVRNGAFFIASAIRVLFLLNQVSVTGFALLILIEQFLVSFGLITLYKFKVGKLTKLRATFSYAIILLRDSSFLIFSALLITLYMQMDQVMLGQMIGDFEVGIYAAAVKISKLWYFIPTALVSALAPFIIRVQSKDDNLFEKRIQKALNIFAGLSYLVASSISFSANHIVFLLYGKDYSEAGLVLSIHIWAGMFVSFGLIRNVWTTTRGLMKFELISTSTGALVNLTLNYILIPRYGALGAAIATLFAQFIASYGSNYLTRETRSIFIKQTKAIFLPLVFFRRVSNMLINIF